jgi:hypothetical protein
MPFCHAALTSVTTAEQQLRNNDRWKCIDRRQVSKFFCGLRDALLLFFLQRRNLILPIKKAVADSRTDSFLREKKP